MSKSFEQLALDYIAWVEHGLGIKLTDLTPAVISQVRAGDDVLAAFNKKALRSKTGRTAEEDERRRWVYDCAVLGDTIADVMNVDRWAREPDARRAMAQRLSDYLGVHFMGRDQDGPTMPPLRFTSRGPRGSYRPYTRQIKVLSASLEEGHPWTTARTVVHERAHDWQTRILARCIPSGHVLPRKVQHWRETLDEEYTRQEIERDAYQTTALAMLRWGLRLDGAEGFSLVGLDTRQAMYGILNATRRPRRLLPHRWLLHKVGI